MGRQDQQALPERPLQGLRGQRAHKETPLPDQPVLLALILPWLDQQGRRARRDRPLPDQLVLRVQLGLILLLLGQRALLDLLEQVLGTLLLPLL